MTELSIHTKLDKLPKNLKKEVSDFIDFLTKKSSKKREKITPEFGSARDKIKILPGFDDPIDDFKEYM